MRGWHATSIGGRLVRSLVLWSVLWCVGLGGAVWVIVQEEVGELLDDTLQSAAEGLIGPLAQGRIEPAPPPASSAASTRFTWQLVGYAGGRAQVVSAAHGAPAVPLHASPRPGLSEVAGWRVFGLATARDGQMVYVAQTSAERAEAGAEVALAVLLAGAPLTLLAVLGLRWRVARELQPLRELSRRLARYDPLQPGARLGAASRDELQPVHAAIDALAARLARRVADERAFTAHAAHALRTPLAGIDAQLAVALREADAAGRPRLQRVRAAADRLQRVVVALLALFRSGAEVQRGPLDVAVLAARLSVEGLAIDARGAAPLHADADLVTAALLNLLENAQRHGARSVSLSTPAANVLRLHDDGSGVDAERRQALQAAIDVQDYAGRTGLGLMLADLVARAHGGGLRLPEVPQGFAVELRL
ncbi:sensor histidine kinase [Piscinibacter koreensis]|uniref:histidine kinase n=1 Tax=Piscinibacter koreensis TaxID=2742824 RepID=A0A7Y6NNY1_9BURK|nr:ATP-binding protein [Schlegelella koreensis]NUZ06609.1 sensor histidine kinase [Schlegelella koreensis]